MIKTQITIINKLGLHARAAAKLATCCARFGSQIKVGVDGRLVDGKSVMSLMLLAASQGTVIDLEVVGSDEQLAHDSIKTLIDDYFGEGE